MCSVLVSQRNDYRTILDHDHLNKLTALLEASLESRYSRMAHVRAPKAKLRKRRWTEKDWVRHLQWLEYRAKPKKKFLENEICISHMGKPKSDVDYVSQTKLASNNSQVAKLASNNSSKKSKSSSDSRK